MKLITELHESVDFVTEAKESGEKNHYIQGIFLQSAIKNKNGRLYPTGIMEKEVGRYLKDVVEQNRAYGELGHPQGPQINLDRVSHLIVELKQDKNDWIGKAKLTDTPMGNIAKGLLKSGARLGVSSRGMGTLTPTKEGVMEVQGDFKLATAADIVADPSAPNAFVNGIMEGVEWFWDPIAQVWSEERLHDTVKHLHTKSTRELEEQKMNIFKFFIESLSSR